MGVSFCPDKTLGASQSQTCPVFLLSCFPAGENIGTQRCCRIRRAIPTPLALPKSLTPEILKSVAASSSPVHTPRQREWNREGKKSRKIRKGAGESIKNCTLRASEVITPSAAASAGIFSTLWKGQVDFSPPFLMNQSLGRASSVRKPTARASGVVSLNASSQPNAGSSGGSGGSR